MTEWRWPHFSREEIECPCCHLLSVSEKFMEKLEAVRRRFGKPMHVNSACRCKKHNAKVGGKPDSEHLAEGKDATAVDIKDLSDEAKWELSSIAYAVNFHRVIVYDRFLHIGDDKAKAGGMLRGPY